VPSASSAAAKQRAHRLVGHLDGGRIHPARFQRDRAERSSGSRLGARALDAAPFDLEVGAGMAHDARGAQMQEGRRRVAGSAHGARTCA
jgi:hypothetical protein